jgi:hypothetical protein
VHNACGSACGNNRHIAGAVGVRIEVLKAHHLARTALRVLANCAPGYEPTAVPHAVALIEDGRPAARPLISVS